MRKITVNLYMTLDGYGEFPKYPGSDVRSKKPDEAFIEMGRGKHYWGSMLKQQTLKLLSVKSLKYGELILHYETVR